MSLMGLIGPIGLIGPKSPFKIITTMKKLLIILFGCLLCFGAAAQELTVGSYNLRNKNQHDSINGNGWNRRVESIANQIIWEHPDLFGTQEGLHEQLVDLDVRLKDYKWIGVARDDGKQEETAWSSSNKETFGSTRLPTVRLSAGMQPASASALGAISVTARPSANSISSIFTWIT